MDNSRLLRRCCPSVSAHPAKVLLCTQNVCTKVLLCCPWPLVSACRLSKSQNTTTCAHACTTTTKLHGHQALAMLVLIASYLLTYKFPNSVDKIFTSFKLPKSIFERPSVCFVESSSEKFVDLWCKINIWSFQRVVENIIFVLGEKL